MRISDWSSDVCSSDLDVDQNLLCHPKQLLSTITASSPTALPARHQLPLSRLRERDGVRERQVARTQPRFRTPPTVQPFRTAAAPSPPNSCRSEEHTSELQSLMRISYAVFCLKKKKKK